MKSYIPAGAGEKMQYIVHPFNDNTIRFVLRYPSPLQADALKIAAHALAESVDVLHASFSAGAFGARWRINKICPEDCFRLIDADRDPVDMGLALALEPISPSSPAQLRCILVQGEKESAVVLLVSHLCADGSDGKYLLKKLCEAYELALRTGSCASLHVKNGKRNAEQAYSHLKMAEKMRILRDPRSKIKSVFPFPSDEPGRPTLIRRRISQEEMSAAHTKAKSMGATVNDLLLTACYHAYIDALGQSSQSSIEKQSGNGNSPDPGAQIPVSIMGMMDLRRSCPGGDSQGLCNLSGALTTQFPHGIGKNFTETLSSVAAQTGACKQDPLAGLYGMPLLHGAAKMLPMGLLLAAARIVYASMSLGLTNIGNINGSSLKMGGVAPCEGWFGGPVKRKKGLQVSAASFDGACSLCIWGYAADEDQAALEDFLGNIAQRIRAFALQDC